MKSILFLAAKLATVILLVACGYLKGRVDQSRTDLKSAESEAVLPLPSPTPSPHRLLI